MSIGTLPGMRYIPKLVKHQLRASLYATAFVCCLVMIFSWLATRKGDRNLGADMYVMF